MKVLAIVLAEEAGERLRPLTDRITKPFLPFGGAFRLIDLALSNCINSELRETLVITRKSASSLNRYLQTAWAGIPGESGYCVELLTAGKASADDRKGTAGAVYRNRDRIEQIDPDLVLVLSADHVYKLDYQLMVDRHLQQGVDVTVATAQVSPDSARGFGIAEMDPALNVTGFEEKPQHEQEARSILDANRCSASMGIYLFRTGVLLDALADDARDAASAHDFGRDLMPSLVKHGRVSAFDFSMVEGSYWRDLSSIESYHEANMELISSLPAFDLHDTDWPIRGRRQTGPPARFTTTRHRQRMGMALDSLVSSGCVISGARVQRSVLGTNVVIENLSDVHRTVVFPDVKVGKRCRINNAIIDQGVEIPDGTDIGFDLNADRRAGQFISESGVVIVTAAPPMGSRSNVHASA